MVLTWYVMAAKPYQQVGTLHGHISNNVIRCWLSHGTILAKPLATTIPRFSVAVETF